MLTKLTVVSAAFFLTTAASQAQGRYFTKTAKVDFFSKSPMENIEAKNKAATLVLDTKTGALQIGMLMKGFEFDKALMQEHFNENYVESNKFPKADFKGTITNTSDINFAKAGTYNAKVKGSLTIHGVTRDIETTGTVKVNDDNIKAESTFSILLSDYGIKIPAIVKDKISNAIRITIDSKLEPLK
jgi:polyisoprenoid-binding protein YceI